MQEEKEGFVFSSENTIIRIATTSSIISWLILLLYVAIFITSIAPLFNGSVSWSQVVAQPTSIFNLIYPLIMGMVYFCALQGIVRLLHLGLDIFYALTPDELEEGEMA